MALSPPCFPPDGMRSGAATLSWDPDHANSMLDRMRTTTLAPTTILLALASLAACTETPREAPRGEPGAGAARVDTAWDSIASTAPDSQSVSLETRPPVRKYGIGAGVVTYRNSVLGREQTLYFDEFGGREAVYLGGGDADSAAPFDVSIHDGTWRIDYSRRERTGIAKGQGMPLGPMLGLVPDLGLVRTTPLEGRTIAGRKAEGFGYAVRIGDARVWLWQGIPLRLEQPLSGGGTLVLEATSVSTETTIPPERFTVPEGIAISRLR